MRIDVDAIFVISLPNPNPRRRQIDDELRKYHINYLLFEATKGINGISGLQDSIKRLFTFSLGLGHKKILVLEDDSVVCVHRPIELANKCLQELPEDFDCFQLGANLVTKPSRYSLNLFQVSYTHSTHAVVYSDMGMKKILDILDYKTHLDALIHSYIQPHGKCFCSREMIFNQRDGYSDIEKRETRYGTMMKRKFENFLYGFSTDTNN